MSARCTYDGEIHMILHKHTLLGPMKTLNFGKYLIASTHVTCVKIYFKQSNGHRANLAFL